jgi:poly(A) polymerase
LDRLPQDGILRLFALSKGPTQLKDRFRLSNAQGQRIDALMVAPDVSPALSKAEQRRLIYQLGADGWKDAVALSQAKSRASLTDRPWRAMLKLADSFQRPEFPVSGHDLTEKGITPGPKMGQLLRDLEDWWLASDFKPGKDELLDKLEEMKN